MNALYGPIYSLMVKESKEVFSAMELMKKSKDFAMGYKCEMIYKAYGKMINLIGRCNRADDDAIPDLIELIKNDYLKAAREGLASAVENSDMKNAVKYDARVEVYEDVVWMLEDLWEEM